MAYSAGEVDVKAVDYSMVLVVVAFCIDTFLGWVFV